MIVRRNLNFALSLLEYIQEGDADGFGLYRQDLRELFEEDSLAVGLNTEEKWNAVDYHLHLLETAGFVIITPSELEADPAGDRFELTWAGHDYYDQQLPD